MPSKLLERSREREPTRFANGEKIFRAKTVQLHSIMLDSLNVHNPQVVFIPSKRKFYDIVGLDFLSRFSSVIFDFPDEKLLLGGVRPPPEIDADFRPRLLP
jgi:hypothetical protein